MTALFKDLMAHGKIQVVDITSHNVEIEYEKVTTRAVRFSGGMSIPLVLPKQDGMPKRHEHDYLVLSYDQISNAQYVKGLRPHYMVTMVGFSNNVKVYQIYFSQAGGKGLWQ